MFESIANTGQVDDGVNKVMDLFSSRGGMALGAAVEAFKQTPAGEQVANALTGSNGQ